MNQLDKIVALAKRRGFVYQAAEIYGGLNGVYDFGHLGFLLKRTIREAWIQSIFTTNSSILFMEGSLLGPHAMWQASGHTQNFSDPMLDCTNCKRRFRADEIDSNAACPVCGKKAWTDIRQFQLMFQTQVGASTDTSSIAYLRPETAQTIFVQFKNMIATNRVKIPFGIAQIGKAFRNEITPKQFLFRMREFEQMELEWFCKPDNAEHYFSLWSDARFSFYKQLGIKKENLKLRTHESHELAHYAKQTVDIEYQFPFGWKEVEGVANRGNYDLSQHKTHSGKDLAIYDETTHESYIPYVVESSVGVDRLLLMILCDAYTEDEIDGQPRTVLKIAPRLAPIKASFLPLVKKLSDSTHKIFEQIAASGMMVEFDESGSIGKRYRRQDEIGTPFCVTYDFESQENNTVTIRHRDTTQQERISIDRVGDYLRERI